MAAATAFALRPTERNLPAVLEGAFRIHLLMKYLSSHGLKPGDLVSLKVSGEHKGFAIAWASKETKPGPKPVANVTDTLREKYGLSLNDPVTIEKAGDQWKPADQVIITLDRSLQPAPVEEGEEGFLHWIRSALENIEILCTGCYVNIQPTGSLCRPRNMKQKIMAKVDMVEPSDSAPLYFDVGRTRLTVTGSIEDVVITSPHAPQTPSYKVLRIEGSGIGGLDEHIGIINQRLARVTQSALVPANVPLVGNTSFLIHGPEGTGKSMLLDRLSRCSWQKVFHLNQHWFASNAKNQAKAVENTFCDARESQPSLILLDDLDKVLGKAQTLVEMLTEELNKLHGYRVVVAAAARSVYDVDPKLRMSNALKVELEIFPPNKTQRQDILQQILTPDDVAKELDFSSLADRTHGFVGRDLYKLCALAADHHWMTSQESDGLVATQHDFNAVMDQVQPSVLKDDVLEVPKVKWTDIAGVDHVREKLDSIIVRPYRYPDLELVFGPGSQKGILLYGPPGCAKTLIAQAVATESNQNFLAVKGSELIKMYVGESERAIRDVFRRARAAKPCIMFFDEFDSIGKSREKSQDSGLNVVTTLLNEMDGIEALKDVFVIAATNRPDILDSALIRVGRFDHHIHIGLPNLEARQQIFEIHTRKFPLAQDVDLRVLASRTEGSSGADISGICAIARDEAISDWTKNPQSGLQAEVRQAHFDRALDDHRPRTTMEEALRYIGWRPGKSLGSG